MQPTTVVHSVSGAFYGELRHQILPLLTISLLACCGCLFSGCKNASRGTVASQFDAARTSLLQGRFETARKRLTDFVEEHANHHLAGRATFLTAKSYIGLEDFDNAKLWFVRTVQRFPKSEEAHKAKFKLAMIDVLSNDPKAASRKLAELLDDANGPYVPEDAELS